MSWRGGGRLEERIGQRIAQRAFMAGRRVDEEEARAVLGERLRTTTDATTKCLAAFWLAHEAMVYSEKDGWIE